MRRIDANRAAEMEVFVRVVDLGGFTAAAREFRLTPSGVSKLISRLERRLSARLVNRSTRRLQLTPDGHAFYDRAVGGLVCAFCCLGMGGADARPFSPPPQGHGWDVHAKYRGLAASRWGRTVAAARRTRQ